MDRVELSVGLREGKGKGGARKIRALGKVPGIVYGKKMESILIETNPKELSAAISGKSGMNTIIDLKIPNHGTVTTLLKDYQAHNITRAFTHVDFVQLDLTKKIRVDIPVHITGKSEGVKEGGILEIIKREISVICLPTNIPEQIDIDVTSLKIGQSLHLSNLKLPSGVEAPQDVDFTIVSVVAPKAEEVAKPAEGAAAEPEVLTAKKPAEGADDKKADKK
ncbi:MAG: 50S ribosomal protein L25/general stress protein Ctc [Deltaproteobacteria bacterium]|nr:50S ribosomal protein L25/general stress protein Ctc [Deltaproteobacteria bacterium]